MLRIGDFSQLAQISVRTLRLYDEMGLFKPAQIDRFTEYRYYNVEQLPRLNRILALKDLGLSLDQIKQLMIDDVPLAALQLMLSKRQAEIDQQVREEQARMTRVKARLQQIAEEGSPPRYDVVLKRLEPLVVAGARANVPTFVEMSQTRFALLKTLYAWLEQQAIEPLLPELALYHEPEYKEIDIQLEQATAVNPVLLGRTQPGGAVGIHQLPGVAQAACLVHHGEFWGVPRAIVALYDWIGRHGYASTGAIRESHLFGREYDLIVKRGADATDNPVITVEIQVPVEPSEK